ncbi:hypothetical protein LCGC14_0174460 [marine sediment metagenome]|uniref:Uncharacterized protein n=1 Tax=marine sediment metagenome TaxID=412755 RepID=A0A0F9V784_9ZZZZ
MNNIENLENTNPLIKKIIKRLEGERKLKLTMENETCKHGGEKINIEFCDVCFFCKKCGSLLGDIDCTIHGM